jgi:hypothetical protein
VTYQFDDGGTVAADTRIQQGVIALLQPLLYQDGDAATARGPYLRTLEAIPQMPDLDFMEAQRTEFMRRMPGVLVYVGGGERVPGAAGLVSWYRRHVLLVVFSGVAGDVVDGRLDETAKDVVDTRDDPGVRVARQHVCELLDHKFLPIDGVISEFRVDDFMHLETTSDWSSWGIRGSLTMEETACASDTRAAAPLDAIRTLHDVNDKGVVAQQKEELTP